MKKIVREYDQQLKNEASQKTKLEAEKNREAGESYLAVYKENTEDVIELKSGLVYRVLTEGFGAIPTDKDRVVVHYTGKLINGSVFDSSVDRGEPSKFMVGGVIQGWQEALQLMKVGSKWELVIPSNLAYGERTTGNIPVNSTLIFEVELLGIE
ncbi:MAG: FKBP-type peptidyl-prolyl cis-trans isomerase [Candidatus Marinimicrobia bacterium]|nr:FKBP-type peptidyl-prolyl cis-trans isomerase [Candidatus Neomarinimicrobiota bacterium]